MTEARLVYSDDPDLRHALGGRWVDRRDMQREQERVHAEAAIESGRDMALAAEGPPTPRGDSRRLRGVPLTGHGGAVKGSRPGECRHSEEHHCFLCRDPSATV